ncbi:MAG: aminopeptidase P family protein [Deltaproteobacteria bacterium]|nr:aminopeptidase P family protein [Deltaproteobacteria bacterium]
MPAPITDPLSYDLVPAEEIFSRISKLQERLADKGLDGAVIPDGINMFYFTGTMQNGFVFVPAKGEAVFLVRRNLERAKKETPIKALVPFRSISQLPVALQDYGCPVGRVGVDETGVAVSIYKKLSAAFPQTTFEDISLTLSMIRAVKSDHEIALIREAGRRHQVIYDRIPGMIREGMTEWELGSEIHAQMLKLGCTGLMRLAGLNDEFLVGVISFGESGNYPTAGVGPDGLVGLSPAFPFVGGGKRLEKGEIIFVDTGFAYQGYFTDATRIYALGTASQAAVDAHSVCLDIQEAVRGRLKPGMIASEIFQEVYQTEVLPRSFEEHFMGFGSNQTHFLGHGIGLVVDEFPVIAGRVDVPLQKNMVIAVEPKKGLKGIGLVGVENTFLVTEQGGENLTPGHDEILVV